MTEAKKKDDSCSFSQPVSYARCMNCADSDSISAWSLVGMSALAKKNLDQAMLAFEKVLALSDGQEMPQVLAALIGCYLEQGDVNRARQAIERQKNWSASPVLYAQHLLVKIACGDIINAKNVSAADPDEIARQWPHLVERLLLGGAVEEIERVLFALTAITLYSPQLTSPLSNLFARFRLSKVVDWTEACGRRVAGSPHR